MRYQSKPQDSEFLTDPADSFKTKSTAQSSSVVQKEDKKEAEFQYNLELLCSSEEVKNYNLKSFLLASTEQEKDANRSWVESTNQDSMSIILTTSVYVDEPKTLHYQFSGSKSSAFNYEEIKPVKKGNTSHTESFIPIKPSVQIGQRLGWPTEGYFYHFIDDVLLSEYKILGDNKWAFSVTASTNELLTDTLLSKQAMTTILLPYKINGETIERQHILYKREKITKEQWDCDINADWLDEHACVLNMKDVVSARSEPILEKEESEDVIYIVKSGNMLGNIAQNHGLSLAEIIELNPKYKDNPHSISPGDKIVIGTHQQATSLPDFQTCEIPPKFHICQLDTETNQRETWIQIAAKYNLAPKALLELNNRYNSDPTALAVGDELIVEVKTEKTPEKVTSHTLPAEDITTDKKVYAFANTQCTADDDIHMYVKPLVDLGDANKNTPVVKTTKLILQSTLLQNVKSLELLAKNKGTLLKKGSKGPAVKAIQEALLTMNIDIGSATTDKVFGNNTHNAIMQFQQEFKVTNKVHHDYQSGSVDGIVGKNTLLALDEALSTSWAFSEKYWSVVFKDVGSIETDSVYNQLVQVFDATGLKIIEVKGSSEPNPFKPKTPTIKGSAAYPYVKKGIYSITHGLHRGKPALVLNSNAYVPTTEVNPNYPEYGNNANYIHVHWGYSETWKGSAGCMTIHPDDWTKFLSSIPKGKGEITIP